MVTLWRKLKRLQPILKRFSKPVNGVNRQLEKAINNLMEAHHNLSHDRMNIQLIDRTKTCIAEVLQWSQIEEQVMRQKAKLE